MPVTPPLLLDPLALEARLQDGDLRIVDLSEPEAHARDHLPGATPMDYDRLVRQEGEVLGLLPREPDLATVLGEAGLHPDSHVVAYDDAEGARAARLLWTLDLLGHRRAALLDGGLQAWQAEGLPVTREATPVTPTDYPARVQTHAAVDREWIEAHREDPGVVLLDVRSAEEYHGREARARRGGHIPGAVHYEWTRVMDPQRQHRLRPGKTLLAELSQQGVTRERTVVVYCHSHRRSAHSYWILRHLGFRDVRAYPGSWSEWGHREDTPVAT
ncbi:MAG: sulfurtransferase [Ectothiorhodospira sp.]